MILKKFIVATFLCFLKTSDSATATFSKSNSGVDGYVTVNDGIVSVALDIGSIDYTKLPGAASCLAEGFTFHLHEKWTYSDSTDRIGASACGSSYTGGHYDPYLACGSKSGNHYCEINKGCVTSSSAFNSNDHYACNTTNYEENPYVCEVGDWSGKYGTLDLDGNVTALSGYSFWEVHSSDVQGRSVVVHCANTGQRAFCAPFDSTGDADSNNIWQDDDEEIYGAVLHETGEFPDSLILFASNGSYSVFFSLDSFDIPCTSGLIYRIYDSWTSSSDDALYGNSECAAVVGQVWDPTVTCLHGSDSSFCNSAYQLCSNTSYSYSCNSNNRYSCSPSDLSGKYGAVSTTTGIFEAEGADYLLPPFELLDGKSFVLECADYSQIVSCAPIVSVSDIFYSTTEEPEYSSTYIVTMESTMESTMETTEDSEASSTSSPSGTSSSTSVSSTSANPSSTNPVTTKKNKSQGCSHNINIFLAFSMMALVWWQSN
jgi:hypothetical protein